MRIPLILCVLVAFVANSFAATNQVSFDLGIYSSSAVSYKQVRIKPSTGSFPRVEGNQVVGLDYGFVITDANGKFTNAMVTGTYDITFTNRFLPTTFQITVPATNFSGILTAAELTTVGTNLPANTSAYSQAQANATFIAKSSGSGTNTSLSSPRLFESRFGTNAPGSSNFVWSLTNIATGEGEWRAAATGVDTNSLTSTNEFRQATNSLQAGINTKLGTNNATSHGQTNVGAFTTRLGGHFFPDGNNTWRVGTNGAGNFAISGGDFPLVITAEGSIEMFELYAQAVHVSDSLDAVSSSVSGPFTIGASGGQQMLNVTASRAAVFDANKRLTNSTITATELGHLSGATVNIPSAIDDLLGADVTHEAQLSALQTQTNALSNRINTKVDTNNGVAFNLSMPDPAKPLKFGANSEVAITFTNGFYAVIVSNRLMQTINSTNGDVTFHGNANANSMLQLFSSNGVGAISFAVPGTWGSSNILMFNVTNWQDGHSLFGTVSGNTVTITNGFAMSKNDVRYWGARGNLSDDTAAFRLAIKYAATNAVGNRRVEVPSAGDNLRFLLDGPSGGLQISNGVEIVGIGEANMIISGVWTDAVFRVAERDDGNPNTTAKFAMRNLNIGCSGSSFTNIPFFDLTGCRFARLEDIWVTAEGQAKHQIGILLSDRNTTNGHESCFFNSFDNVQFSNVGTWLKVKPYYGDCSINDFRGLWGSASNIINAVEATNGFGLGVSIRHGYVSSQGGGTDILLANGASCPTALSIDPSFTPEGFSTNNNCWSTWGSTRRNHNYGYSWFDGLFVPQGYIFSVQGASPLLPESLDDRYLIAGFTNISQDSSTVIRLAGGGTAQNVHRMDSFHPPADSTFTVSNTGSAHVEYLCINTNWSPLVDNRAEILLTTNGSQLVFAIVGVDASGAITTITNLVSSLMYPRLTGRQVRTLPQTGNTNNAAELYGTNGVGGVTVKADGKTGINTNASTYPLHVHGETLINGGLNITGTLSNTAAGTFIIRSASGQNIIINPSANLTLQSGNTDYTGGGIRFRSSAGFIGLNATALMGWSSSAGDNSGANDTSLYRAAAGTPGSTNLFLAGTNQVVAPTAVSAMGAHLWSDGTNLCVVLQNAAGARTTNKVTLTAWP